MHWVRFPRARLPINGCHAILKAARWFVVNSCSTIAGHPYKIPGSDQERNSQQGCLAHHIAPSPPDPFATAPAITHNDHYVLFTTAVIIATNADELLAVTTITAGLLAAIATTVQLSYPLLPPPFSSWPLLPSSPPTGTGAAGMPTTTGFL